MHHDQIQIFEKIMRAEKRISGVIRPAKVGVDSAAQIVRLELSCEERDPLFSKYESSFAAHLRYPFTHCGFSLDCKQKRKAQRPLSTVRFDFSTDKWRLCVYDQNDYSVEKETFHPKSPDVLLEMLGHRWHIENLHEFVVEIEGANQMKLSFKE
jgi:hypothetical protein